MKIEIMIYVYIAICISMIAFNIVYVFVLRHREKALGSNSQKLKKIICDQIEVIKNGKEISVKHIKYLCKKLDRSANSAEVFSIIPSATHWANLYAP